MRSFKIEKTKPIQSYNLPAKYRDECNRFVDKLKKNLGSSIKLLVLTGSGGNEKIVENISDLDFMIVVEDSIESKKVIDLLAKITQNTSQACTKQINYVTTANNIKKEISYNGHQ